MEGAPAEGNASEPQIPSQLRQKMLSRAATFTEGAQSSPTRPLRRRSSVLSDLSDTRHSTRSSTDNLLKSTDAFGKATALEDGHHWLSSPVIFAVVPAVAGLLYQNGAAFLTDLFTLALAAWLLHWCCTWPWWVLICELYDHAADKKLGHGTTLRSSGGTLSPKKLHSMTLFTKKRTKTTSPTTTRMQDRLQKPRRPKRTWALRLPRWHSSKLVRR